MPAMSTKTREVIWGGRIMGAEIRAETDCKRLTWRKREHGPFEWSMEG
jgi:hypothetical protein